jgi:transcriptional regulator with XRE-family HTH domain
MIIASEQVKAARELLRWTLLDVGYRADVSESTIAALERARRTTRPDKLRAIRRALSLSLAALCGVDEGVFRALPNMAGNFYTVPAWPGHERNLMAPDFAADRGDGVAEGQDCFWIPSSGFRLELS